MQVLLILWAIALAACDKLDRTYLPPPGSITASGDPGDLKLPFEPGRDNGIIENGSLGSNYLNPAFGIDRKPSFNVAQTSVTNFPKRAGYTFSNNGYNIPITTTSYAFTQTTTLTPIEGFDTIETGGTISKGYASTISPFSPNSDLSYDLAQKIINPLDQQITDPAFDSSVPDSLISNAKTGQSPQNLLNGAPDLITGRVQISKGVGDPGSNNQFFNGDKSINTNLTNYYPNSNQYFDHQFHIPTTTNEDFQHYTGDLQYTVPSDPKNNNISPISASGQNTFGSLTSTSSSALPSFNNFPSTKPFIDISSTANTMVQPERIQADADRNAIILNYENKLTSEGFAYSFDTSNGIHADENGTATNGVRAQGSYSYTGDDGNIYSVVYTADENGFVPHGDHLPTAPPIPDAILKVIEQAEINKQLGIVDDGSYDDTKYGHGRYQGLRGRMKQQPLRDITEKQTPNNENVLNSAKTVGRHDTLDKSGIPADDSTARRNLNSFKVDGVHRENLPDENSNVFLNSARMETTNGPVSESSKSLEIDDILPETLQTNSTLINSNMGTGESISSGYEYSHPYKIFNDDEGNKLKSRFSNIDSEDDEMEPQEEEMLTDTVTRKPFMTPNVSFNFKSENSNLSSQVNQPNRKMEMNLISENEGGSSDIDRRKPFPFYNRGSSKADDKNTPISDRIFNGRTTEYDSTDPKFYDAPFTSPIISNDRDRQNYPKLTTPLSSENSSRLTSSTNEINYSQTPPTLSEFSSTLRPSDVSEILETRMNSNQPSNVKTTSKFGSVDDRISSTKPTRYEYRVDEYPRYRGNKIPVTRTDFSEIENSPKFAVSNPVLDRSQDSLVSSTVTGPNNIVIQSSKKNMIGEDFSGPKQPPRFDPEHGYYY